MIKNQTQNPARTYVAPSVRVAETRLPFTLMQSVTIPDIPEEEENW